MGASQLVDTIVPFHGKTQDPLLLQKHYLPWLG